MEKPGMWQSWKEATEVIALSLIIVTVFGCLIMFGIWMLMQIL